jgi:hypothetical protein
MKKVLVLVILAGCVQLYSQDYIDIATVSYMTGINSSFENLNSDNSLQEWGIDLDFPIVLDSKNALLTGFSANQIQVRLDPSEIGQTSLQTIAIRLGLNHTYSEKWDATYMIIPKIASDFSNGFATGYQWAVLALFSNTKTPRLKYSYGLYTNTEQYGLMIVPILGGYFKSTNNLWEARVLLPIRVDVNYQLRPNIRAGLVFDGLGTSYSIENETYRDNYVNRSTNELYAYLQHKITPSLFVRAKMGYSFFRAYKVYDSDDTIDFSITAIYFGDDRTVLNTDIDDGFQFKAELVYRFNFSSQN